MIIHHTGSLHVGVTNGGAKKLETTFFHVLTDGIGNCLLYTSPSPRDS